MDFMQSPSGKVIKAGTGYLSFIPNPLPPEIQWNADLVNTLSRADHLVGKLSREGKVLQNPHVLIRPFVTREAVLSSRIEGTQATLGEVLASDVGVQIERDPDDTQEVRNYITALDYGIERLYDLPLSLRFIKEIHATLMQGVRGEYATPGEFRRSQNWIGIPGCTLMTAKYVPPTPEELAGVLGAFELFLHDKTLPPLIHAGLCHYQFEAIHPFLDGNGRVGRLLIILLLMEQAVLESPLLYISAFFEATRDEYYRQLYAVSARGTWNEWLLYFLNGIAVQSADALSRIERVQELIFEWLAMVRTSQSSLVTDIITMLASNPFITIKYITETCNVAFTTAQRGVEKLEALGIVTQTSEGKRDRVYCATKILAILEEPSKTTLNTMFS